MSEKNDGGSAFPVPVLADKDGNFQSCHEWGTYMERGSGLTMRDYFAAHALMGRLASEDTQAKQVMADAAKQGINAAGLYAMSAYTIADAMIAERAK